MGSLTQALSIALSGLQTSTSLISLTSNNISNAQTAGYTKKTASVATVDYGADFGGSTIASYSRATDQALTSDYNTSTTAASYSSTQNDYMKQVQAVLNSTASNPALSTDIANFSSAWSQYASAPESNIQQQNVISTAQTLVNDIHNVISGASSLKAQVQSDIANNVTSLNADLQQIAAINASVQASTSAGKQTVDLQDKQDQLVNKISAYMSVTVQQRSGGQLALYSPSGQLLVDGPSSTQFGYDASTNAITNGVGTDVTAAMGGGSLQAATDFISTSSSALSSTTPGVGALGKLNAQLSVLTTALTSTSNANSFASKYASAVASSIGLGGTQANASVASPFFTVSGTDPSTIAVNSSLTNGTSALPQTGAESIAASFNTALSYSDSTTGFSAPNVTYEGLTSAILSNFQQMANTVSAQSTSATSQQTYYQQSLSNATGVNIDTELANLISYQNSYAASAHIISSVNQMLSTLMSMVQ